MPAGLEVISAWRVPKYGFFSIPHYTVFLYFNSGILNVIDGAGFCNWSFSYKKISLRQNCPKLFSQKKIYTKEKTSISNWAVKKKNKIWIWNMNNFWIFHRSILLLTLKKSSVQIRSFLCSVFSRIRTEYREVSVVSPNAGKYGLEKTPHLDTFHTVSN